MDGLSTRTPATKSSQRWWVLTLWPLASRYHQPYLQMTWMEARKTCLSYNADLASTTLEEERQFAFTLGGKKTTWIGGSDIQTEGVWTWSDGSPWGNPLWTPGNPDNWLNNQNCLRLLSTLWEVVDGLFDDGNCTTKHQFICEGKIWDAWDAQQLPVQETSPLFFLIEFLLLT